MFQVPSIRSARVSNRRMLRNRSMRSSVRTYRTNAQRAFDTGSVDESRTAMVLATKVIDKAARKGVIHPNKAARLKSRIAKKFNSLVLE